MFRAGHVQCLLVACSGTWPGAYEHCLVISSAVTCERRRRRTLRTFCLATARAVISSTG